MRADTKRKHKIRKRFAIVIGVAATGVMALGAQTGAAASEDVVSYRTTLTIGKSIIRDDPYWHKDGALFGGRVKSKFNTCRFGRKVIVFKKRPGRDSKLGASRSDAWATWIRFVPGKARTLPFSRVYAKATRKVGDGFVCRADYATGSEIFESISINTAGSGAFTGAIKSTGVIKSERKICLINRLVVIKRDTPANDPIIARDRTKVWEGPPRLARYLADPGHPVTGAFYARAPRKIGIVSGNRIVCRPLQSFVIHVD